jgi:hypothetical protein
MRIDTSGNLGLGVTPSASFAGYKTFQIASQGVISSDSTSNGELEINNNAYRAVTTAALTYINSFAATKYAQYQGVHRWFTAASGTAGDPITFTQAMTLDASGNLLVGKTATTNTTPGIVISSGLYAATASSTSTNLATNNGAALNLINSSATDGNFSNIGAYNSNGLVVSQIDFINVSHASRTGDIAFLTHNGSSLLERARITAAGDFLVGTTSSATNRRFEVQSTGDGSGQLGLRNSGATAGLYWTMGPNASNNIVVYNQSSVGVFISDGNTSWSSSSDERLKTDLKNIENAFDKVATLRAVTGRFKTDAEGVSRAFLIAQDVESPHWRPNNGHLNPQRRIQIQNSLVEHPAGTARLTGTVRRASHGAIRAERGKRGAALGCDVESGLACHHNPTFVGEINDYL